MTDEDVFEPHSSLANLDFVKGHIENSEKTKLDWIGLFAFFLIIFLSGTNWKPLLQRRISNTQEPSLVFFSSMSIVKDVAHQKMKKKTKEKRKAKTRTFIKVGIFWQPKKRPRNRYLAPTHYDYYFEEANSRTGGHRERETELFTILLLSDCGSGSGSGNGNGRGEYVTGGFCVFDGPILNEWNRLKK